MSQTPETDRTPITRAGDALIGAAVEVEQVVSGGIAAVFGLNKRLWKVTEPLRAPFDALGVTELVTKPVEAVATRVESTVVRLEEQGRDALENSTGVAAQTLGIPITAVLTALMDNWT
ncbi:MAG: hypothetical protein IPK16_31170 [Anaerolineales bacterium]|nr:hypothetical protein [Anaerolineales bacterium]